MKKLSRDKALSILGLKKNSTKNEIRERYLSLLKELHPDNNDSDDVDPKLYQIKEAYECLKNQESEELKVRIFGDAKNRYSFSERRREGNTRLQKEQKKQEERQRKLEKLIQESNKKRQIAKKKKEREESINRAFKSIRSILAARIIEDYLDNNDK